MRGKAKARPVSTGRWRAAAIALWSAALYAVWWATIGRFGLVDPDRYYHLALARLTAEQGLLHVLPQVEDLGWSRVFDEKEFLFHQLLALGYRFGGEGGVVAAGAALGIAGLAGILSVASRFVPLAVGLACVVVAAWFSPAFALRAILLRPHLLAVASTAFLIDGLVARNALIAFVCAAVFALGYHAIYMPGLAAGVALLFALRGPRDEDLLRSAGAALGGLVVGIVVNPYFPSNVTMGLSHLSIALHQMSGRGLGLDYGLEVVPLSAREFATAFAGPLLVLLASAAMVRRRGARAARGPQRVAREALWLTTLAGLDWGLAAVNARAIEYAMPATAMAAAAALRAFVGEKPHAWREGLKKWPVLVVGFLAIAVQVPLWGLLFSHGSTDYPDRSGESLAAVRAIPAELKGAKVLNCEWSAGPYLLYSRPDLRFVDLSDPSLLWQVDRSKSELREALRRGETIDPYGAVRDVFRADVVLCAAPAFNRQLAADPQFERLWPQRPGLGSLTVYRVRPTRDRAFATAFEVALGTDARRGSFTSMPRGPFLNLWAWAAKAGGDPECATVRVSPADVRAHAGSRELLVAGGDSIRVWVNNALAYEQARAVPPFGLLHESALKAKLSGRETITARVCRGSSQGPFALALGLR